jgi:hypothetical protein
LRFERVFEEVVITYLLLFPVVVRSALPPGWWQSFAVCTGGYRRDTFATGIPL